MKYVKTQKWLKRKRHTIFAPELTKHALKPIHCYATSEKAEALREKCSQLQMRCVEVEEEEEEKDEGLIEIDAGCVFFVGQ